MSLVFSPDALFVSSLPGNWPKFTFFFTLPFNSLVEELLEILIFNN